MYAPDKIKRILIIRLAPLGETVLTTPVIRALRQNYQDAYIAYMVAPVREDLVSANPHLNEVLVYQSSIPKLIYQLVRRKFQMAVVLQPTFRLVLHTFLARIPFRVGFETNTGGRRLLHVSVPNNTSQHETQRYLDVVRALDIEVKNDEPEVFVSDKSREWCNNFLGNHNLNDGKPIIGLNPGAATSYRRWSTDNFTVLGDMLCTTYNAHVVITTGPNEKTLAQQVAKQMKHTPIVVDDVSPMQLAALLQRCHLYISNDTGPMHLSTAVETPTIALFGGSNPTQWGPPWEKHTVIARQGCELMPTLSPKEWDDHANVAKDNMNAIKPEMVLDAMEKMKWTP
ncbi:MAG: glycosyltransferase family 9 protein [Candidatus Poribacteria bacterium]|nr:glycosyltransferase family 9 protein [Candidatus Poribacteria bacterium]